MSKQKKVLFTAKVDSHIMQFHIPYLKYFKDNGYEVHVASEGTHEIPYVDFKYDVEFGKNPFTKNNLETFKVIEKLIETHNFDIIHTHTAVASVLTRLAVKKLKKQSIDFVTTNIPDRLENK